MKNKAGGLLVLIGGIILLLGLLVASMIDALLSVILIIGGWTIAFLGREIL